MSENQSQHFVPKCHLREFARDERKKQICVFNLKADRLIPSASLRDQCAKHYFYGEDLILERAFQGFEGRYGEAVKEIKQNKLGEINRLKLLSFALLQYHRTEAAARRVVSGFEDLIKAIDPEERYYTKNDVWDEKQSLREILSIVGSSHYYLHDLKWVVVENKSRVPFVTSDDPASITNMYAHKRLKTKSFGMISSGFTLSLPLSPRFSVIFYDGLVYNFPKRVGCMLVITRDEDARSLNELQYQKCDQNLYCSSPDSEDEIRAGLSGASHMRLAFSAKPVTLQKVSTEGEYSKYAPVKNPDLYEGGEHLIYHELRYPVPNKWFSEMKIRMRPKTFDKWGSSRHVRNPLWLTEAGRTQFLSNAMQIWNV